MTRGVIRSALIVLLMGCGQLLAAEGAGTPLATPRPVDTTQQFASDSIMGDFAAGEAAAAEAKVVAEGDSMYRALVLLDGGADKVELRGALSDGRLDLASQDGQWKAVLEGDALTVTQQPPAAGREIQLKRVNRQSPTLGQKPPAAGAVVLLPLEPDQPTHLDAWQNPNWKLLPDGSILVNRGDNTTRQSFGDCQLHVEFNVPLMAKARGQGRGNSGVYLHDRYEIQVLDSFGILPRGTGDCGAIYGRTPPAANASLPPGVWQTYDITFRAPRFDASGNKTSPAAVTVLHNGIKIHDNVPIEGVTGGSRGAEAPTGPVRFQDHGNPTRFRNVWLVELHDAAPASAPMQQ